jgi:hypothetical protein
MLNFDEFSTCGDGINAKPINDDFRLIAIDGVMMLQLSV